MFVFCPFRAGLGGVPHALVREISLISGLDASPGNAHDKGKHAPNSRHHQRIRRVDRN
jgi:hypothetical protein